MISVTFNNNLGNDYASRGSSAGNGGGGGGFNLGGGRGGGNPLLMLIMGLVGRKFGLPGLIIVGIIGFFLANGGGGILGGGQQSTQQTQTQQTQSGSSDFAHCQTVADANQYDDCRILATQVSLDQFWSEVLPTEGGIDYVENGLFVAEGMLNTGCGAANISQTGPFYCPGDQSVYMSVPFFQQLKQMGGSDGPFSIMYVTAHEVGHHIQQLQGTLRLSDYNNPGEDSNAVRVELQADCYAGLWASNADKGPNALLEPLTQEQVEQAITTARAIGDDVIQQHSGQGVNPDLWTHGSAQQRVEWFLRGYQGGTLASCEQQFL